LPGGPNDFDTLQTELEYLKDTYPGQKNPFGKITPLIAKVFTKEKIILR
jgi:hypothetical protein